MQAIVDSYISIILAQSALLCDNNRFNEAQLKAIRLIDNYTQELQSAIAAAKTMSEVEMRSFMRHQLLNILTPVVGYIEMLADGWIGKLEPDQVESVEIILHAVRDLMAIIQNPSPNTLAS